MTTRAGAGDRRGRNPSENRKSGGYAATKPGGSFIETNHEEKARHNLCYIFGGVLTMIGNKPKRFYNDFGDLTVLPPGNAEGCNDWNDYTEYQLKPIEDLDEDLVAFDDYEEIELTEILGKEIGNNGER